ncbi:Ras-GAP domain-containing protein [Entamoeba marina]
MDTKPYFKTSIFWKLCCVYDHIVVHTLIRYTNSTTNEFWDSLRDILDAAGLLYRILSEEIVAEIANTKEIQCLFRVNSGPSSLLQSVFRKELTPLMEKYINPIILACRDTDIDIDSKDEAVRNHSIETLKKWIDIHTTRFLTMETDFPEPVRALFGSSMHVLSALFFHKIITPAIIAPTKFSSSISTPTDKAKPTLVLLSKIYQVFVNMSEEPFPPQQNLSVFNDAIVESYPKIEELMNNVSSVAVIPDYHFNAVVSSQLLLRKVTPILSHLESLKPAAVATFTQPFIDIGFKNLAENLLALTNIDIYAKDLAKLDLQRPKDVGIFFDETEEESYHSVINGYENTIHLYQKKINGLTEEIFKLNQIIEKLDMPQIIIPQPKPQPQPSQFVPSNTSNSQNSSNSISPLMSPRKEEALTVLPEHPFDLKMNEETKLRFMSLTNKENNLLQMINKSESFAILSKAEKFLQTYLKATKLKLGSECLKISQKDRDKKEKEKEKVKSKVIAKLRKSLIQTLTDAHQNRSVLTQHHEDDRLMKRIVGLTNILDETTIIFN